MEEEDLNPVFETVPFASIYQKLKIQSSLGNQAREQQIIFQGKKKTSVNNFSLHFPTFFSNESI